MPPFTGLDFLSAGALVWCTAVVIAGGFVGGVMGFGFPLVVMPLLTPVLGLKPALLIGVLPTISLTIFGMLAGGNLRSSIGRFWFMPLVMPIGTWVGTQTLIHADPRPFVLLLALALLAYLNMERLGKNDLPLVRRHAGFFGVIAALVGGWFEAVVNVAAPIMLIYFMLVRLDPRSLVQALNYSWVGGKLIQMILWTTSGGVAPSFWIATAPWAALAALVFFVGQRIRHRLEPARYLAWLRRFLWAMSFVLLAQFVLSIVRDAPP